MVAIQPKPRRGVTNHQIKHEPSNQTPKGVKYHQIEHEPSNQTPKGCNSPRKNVRQYTKPRRGDKPSN